MLRFSSFIREFFGIVSPLRGLPCDLQRSGLLIQSGSVFLSRYVYSVGQL